MAAPESSTVTPGSAAPDESVTVPAKLPAVVDCANADVVMSSNERTRRSFLPIFPPVTKSLFADKFSEFPAQECKVLTQRRHFA
jgi:hypothetical protein